MFKIGMLVERQLDNEIFLGKIENIDKNKRILTIRYMDDNNIEDNIPFEDVKYHDLAESKEIENRFNIECKGVRKDTLPKPLLGLIEDDSDYRNSITPIVTIHDSVETEEAIILNGAENKLAAGGGLRAIRKLKN